MRVGNCSDIFYLEKSYGVFGQSLRKLYDTTKEEKHVRRALADTESRCRIAQADTAFIWFAFAAFLVTIGLAFVHRGGKRGSIV